MTSRAAKLKMRLTDAAIRGLPPLAQDQAEQIVWDETLPGLALRVGKIRRSWILVYRPAGAGRASRPQKIGLGVWPTLSPEAARRAAQIEAGRIARGDNPATERREKKRKEKASLASVLDDYERSLKRRQYVNYRTAMSTLRRGLSKYGSRDIASLTRRELIDAIEAQEAAGKVGAAADLRRHLRTMLEWATNRSLTPFNVLAGLRRERATRAERIAVAERGKALTDDELKRVWNASASSTVFGRFVRALIVTGARRGEMARLERGMKLADRLRLPALYTKQGRPHEIPLTSLLDEILADCPLVPRLGDGSGKQAALFFASPSTGRVLGGWTQFMAKLRTASEVEFTLHDLRRTMRSGLTMLSVDHDVAELMLGHQRDDLVRRYDKDDRWPARVAAAAAWEQHIRKTVL